jgi:Pectate lyase superfamily protein
MNHTIDPRDFGAKGDGIADDTDAIWRAAGYAEAKFTTTPPPYDNYLAQGMDNTPRGSNIPRGGIIQFSPGAYRVRRHLPITSGIQYRGTRGSVILLAELKDDDPLFGIYTDRVGQCHNWSIEDLDAYDDNRTQSKSSFIRGITSTAAIQCELRNLSVNGFWDQFEFGNFTDMYSCRFERILCQDPGRCIYNHGQGGTNVFSGFNLEGCSRLSQSGPQGRPLIKVDAGANYISNCLLEGIQGPAPIAYKIGGLGTSFNDNYLEYNKSGYRFESHQPGHGSTITTNTLNMLGSPFKAYVGDKVLLTIAQVLAESDDLSKSFDIHPGGRVHIQTAIGYNEIKVPTSLSPRLKVSQKLYMNRT